jgi:hypothetical protein
MTVSGKYANQMVHVTITVGLKLTVKKINFMLFRNTT